MMKVKTLRAHGSVFGAKYFKKKGDIFDHRAPDADLAAGNVEPSDAAPAKKAAKKAAKKPAEKAPEKAAPDHAASVSATDQNADQAADQEADKEGAAPA
jgi:hypothetical protein